MKISAYDVRHYGAVGDGKSLDTAAIQAAIDACTENGGGDVVIPNGIFLSGTLKLKNNVALFLSPSAVLKGSCELTDYPGDEKSRALLKAEDATNIAVYGRGTLDGHGDHANFQSKDPYNGIAKGRPRLVFFKRCSRVKIKECSVTNGAFWNVTLQDCDRITVDDVQFQARVVANNDGLDIVDCHDTAVSNCYFDCGDDALCPKSHSKRKVKRLTITNCILKSESNAIKFGTMGVGGFEDVTISNCVVFDTRLSGIALEMVDGGSLNRITVSNIVMNNVNNPFFLKIGTRKGETPVLRDIVISNLVAEGIGAWQPDRTQPYFKEPRTSLAGASLYGQPGLPLKNITLSNIQLRFVGGGTQQDAAIADFKDKNPKAYPEYDNFGTTPAYGLNCRHVENLHVDNLSIEFQENDLRPAIMLQDVRGARLNFLRFKTSPNSAARIRIKNSQNVFVTNSDSKTEKTPLLSIEGSCEGVTSEQ